jgi:hypothetical protein
MARRQIQAREAAMSKSLGTRTLEELKKELEQKGPKAEETKGQKENPPKVTNSEKSETGKKTTPTLPTPMAEE